MDVAGRRSNLCSSPHLASLPRSFVRFTKCRLSLITGSRDRLQLSGTGVVIFLVEITSVLNFV